jgi:deoxyadenosine/deoxycytidine kinase
MEFQLPRNIVVEGPIGVGKTTLAESLAKRLNARLLLEKFEDNPFLPLFYKDPERYALQTELSFLISRFHQQESYRQEELFSTHTLSDYLFSKCALFASLTLGGRELQLFEEVYRVLERSIPHPDLVIHLQAPVNVLLQRIQHRGRAYEKEISADYLEQLCNLYYREFSSQTLYPVISLDTTAIDFRKSEHIDRLMMLIESRQRGWIKPEQFLEFSRKTVPNNWELPLSAIS